MDPMVKLEPISPQGRIVVLSGAGVSAESGIRTFRDNGGLWEEYSVYEVATPEAWQSNPRLVLDFYNQRRKQLLQARPNPAHYGLAALQEGFQVQIITQNIDDLHERAGSKQVLHLHGELLKARSTADHKVYPVAGQDLKWGDLCPKGAQLRPHVVWFGEAVPMIEPAQSIMAEADLVVVVGTSLNVYPAAGLVHAAAPEVPVLVIDPAPVELAGLKKVHHWREKASTGVSRLLTHLREQS